MSGFRISDRARCRLIRGDGIFLLLMGCFGLVADLASYTAGAGPFGATFLHDPQVIGVVEAHGLALLTGVAACATGSGPFARYWNGHLAVTHLLLGGANIAFFGVFVAVDGVAGGIAITAVHFALVVLQAGAAMRPPLPIESAPPLHR